MAKGPFKMRSGNSPILKAGLWIVKEGDTDATQVSKTDYDAFQGQKFARGKSKADELSAQYDVNVQKLKSRGASKGELADYKEAFISGKFQEMHEAADYMRTEEGKAEEIKQKELDK